jgi:hypothetical protein
LNSHVFPWIFIECVITYIYKVIIHKINQMCTFKQKYIVQNFLLNICLKSLMIDYKLSWSNITFFNIIQNATKHIHKKMKYFYLKCINLHEIATLPSHTTQKMFCLLWNSSYYVILMVKIVSNHKKRTSVDHQTKR